MDQSSFGPALDGNDLGGNEVRAARMVSVSHRSEAEGIVTAKTSRIFREAIAWDVDESVVLSRPATVSDGRTGRVIVFGERTFRFVVCRFLVRWASCVGPFAEAGARYRVALSRFMAGPKGSVGRAGGAQQEIRHASAGRSAGVSNHPGRAWSRRGLLFAWCRTWCRAPLHTQTGRDEHTRLFSERRLELETGA
jgi:hypothetical protein